MKFPRKYHASTLASYVLRDKSSQQLTYPVIWRHYLTPSLSTQDRWVSGVAARRAAGTYKIKLLRCRKLQNDLRLPLTTRQKRSKRRKKNITLTSSQKVEVRRTRKQLLLFRRTLSKKHHRSPRRRARSGVDKLRTTRGVQNATQSHVVYRPGSAEADLGYFAVQRPTSILKSIYTPQATLLLDHFSQGPDGFASFKASYCANDFAYQSRQATPAYSIHIANLVHWWVSADRYSLPTLSTFATSIASNKSITFRPQFFNYSRMNLVTLKEVQLMPLTTRHESFRSQSTKFNFSEILWNCRQPRGEGVKLLQLSQKQVSRRTVRDLVVAMAGRSTIYRSFAKQFFISSRKNFYLYNLLPDELYSHLKIRVDRMTPQCRQRVYVKPLKNLIGHQVRGLPGALQYTFSSDGNEQQLETSCGVTLNLAARTAYTDSTLGFVAAMNAAAADSNAGEIFFHQNVAPFHRKQVSLHYRTSAFDSQALDIIGSRQLFLENNFWNKHLHTSPLIFKYVFWTASNTQSFLQGLIMPGQLKSNLADHFRFNFSTRRTLYHLTNLWPTPEFSHTTKRRLIKMVTFYKFLPRTFIWWNDTLIRFMEHHSGRRVYLKLNSFIENSLPYVDLARCNIWFERVIPWQRVLGHRIFVQESLRIFHLAIRFRDPTFLCNWLKGMLFRLSFWKYRVLFRYVKFVMRNLFFIYFDDLGFKGLKLRLKGKISVAGNARTRTLVYRIGETGHATVNNRVLSEFTTIESFTGVMGFRVSIYF